MGRRRKTGRDISGWVILDKPSGMTSTAAVSKVRWAFDARKAGHAGTLDPAATGLLAIALGEATKTVPVIADALKCYRFTVTLGAATSTDDAEGEVVATSSERPDTGAIEAALEDFRGQITQVPPQFSAVKVDGERAYDLARDGETLALEARPLFVDRLDLVERPDADHVTLEMVCGKGGYVRAIARDLGDALGCHGHVRELRRLWSGPFTLEGAVTIGEIEEGARSPALDARILPLEAGLKELPEIRVSPLAAARLRNGNAAEVATTSLDWGDVAWASENGEAVAVGRYKGGALHPSRVFVR